MSLTGHIVISLSIIILLVAYCGNLVRSQPTTITTTTKLLNANLLEEIPSNFTCYGKNNTDPNVCSGSGKCISLDNCDCHTYGYTGMECETIALFNDIYNQKAYSNCSKVLAAASNITRYQETVLSYIDGQGKNQELTFPVLWETDKFISTGFSFEYDTISLFGFSFTIIEFNQPQPLGRAKLYNTFRHYPLSQDFELNFLHTYPEVGYSLIPNTIQGTTNPSLTYYLPKSIKGIYIVEKNVISNEGPVNITFTATGKTTIETLYFSNNVPEPVYELDAIRGKETLYCLGYHCVFEFSGVYPNNSVISTNFYGDYSFRNSNKSMVRFMNYDSTITASNYYDNNIGYSAKSEMNGLIGRNLSFPIKYVAYTNIPLSLSFYEKQQPISKSFIIKSLLSDPYVLKVSNFSYQWNCSFKASDESTFSSFSCPNNNDPTQLSFSSNYFKKEGALNVILSLGYEVVSARVYLVNQDIPQIRVKSILPKIHPITQAIEIGAYIQSSNPIKTYTWGLDFGIFYLNDKNTSIILSENSTLSQINDNLYLASLTIYGKYIRQMERYNFTLNIVDSLGLGSYIKLSTTIDRSLTYANYVNYRANATKIFNYCSRQESDFESVSNVFAFLPNSSTKRFVVSNTLKYIFSTDTPYLRNSEGYVLYNSAISQHGSNFEIRQQTVRKIPQFPSEGLNSFIEDSFRTIQQSFPTSQNILGVFSFLEYLTTVQVDSVWLESFIPQVNQYLVNFKDDLGNQIEDKLLPTYVTTISTMFEVVSNKTSLDMTTEVNYWLSWFFTTLKTAKQFYNSNVFSLLLVRSHVSELNFMLNLYANSPTANFNTTLSFFNDLNSFSMIFVRDYLDEINEIIPISLNIDGMEFSTESLDTPLILNSKITNLTSSGISILYPKSMSSAIDYDEPISVLSYASKSNSGSVGSLLTIEMSTQSGNSIPINNLADPIVINFQLSIVKPDNKTFSCQYFDTQQGIWTNNSISTSFSQNPTGYSVSCNTTHLTQFGVFLLDSPRSIIIPPVPVAVVSSNNNSTIKKTPSSNDTLTIVLAVVIPVVFIIIVIIVIIIIVVIVLVRRMKRPNKEPINHFNDNIIPIEENQLLATSVNDIELSETKDNQTTTSVTFPSTQATSTNQTNSDFPSSYASAYQYKESMNEGSNTGTYTTDPITSRYKEMVKIGSGGFGSVFKCIDVKTNSYKAIKVMGFESFEALNDMMKEATQLMNIKHENIIRVNDMFVSPPQLLCIDMELYDKGDLTKYMKPENNCPEQLLKQICYQMLDALNYVHTELNCCHRDVKPSNIFIRDVTDQNISIVLADFGLAKSNQNSLASYSGTPLYMSPEIALGSSNYGNNVDIYSLGISIYQLITKDIVTVVSQMYFKKEASVVKAFLEENMKASGNYSNELIAIVIDMLDKDPDVRPQAIDLLKNPYFADLRK